MRKTLLTLTALAGLLSSSSAFAGATIVLDPSNLAQAVQQLATLQEQVTRMKQTYDGMNGSRGMSGLLNKPELKNYLPADWQSVYDQVKTSSYGGFSTDTIRQQEQLKGTTAEQIAAIRSREANKVYADKAMGQGAYAGMQKRLGNIEQMLGQIDGATDPKAIQDLQARIDIEQAAIQNEQTKLQLMSMLQQAEGRLVEQQKRELGRKMMNPNNTGYPDLYKAFQERGRN
jgi:type IV secretion system protein VirB5